MSPHLNEPTLIKSNEQWKVLMQKYTDAKKPQHDGRLWGNEKTGQKVLATSAVSALYFSELWWG